MKRIFFVALVLVLGLSLNSFAKEHLRSAPETNAATVGHKKNVIKSIFNYKTELGLTDKQEADIKELLLGLQNTLQEKVGKVNVLRGELIQMIRDNASLKVIRKKIEDIGKVQVDIIYKDIEVSRKIEDTLSSEQLVKWRSIQKERTEKLKSETEAKSR